MNRAEFIAAVKALIKEAADETAAEVKALYPDWNSEKAYKKGDRVLYEGALFKCLQDHTAQAGWNPKDAASLWAEVLIPDPEVIPDWVQPESTNPYMKGDKVRHLGKVWISNVDNNVWEPPTMWTEVLK